MKFLRIWQHLLANGKATRLTAEKQLRQFFAGLSFDAERKFFDEIWLDIFPETTRQLDLWEMHFFGVVATNLTDQERRDRLDATWKAQGGQDPRYIQDTLQANGFNVFIHEWWEPGTEPGVGVKRCVEPRNPFLYLKEDNAPPIYTNECGEQTAECGEAGADCGESLNPTGFALVNKVVENVLQETMQCGEQTAECGEAGADCGERAFVSRPKVYTIPTDREKWPYFLYIGGETFPNSATVDAGRRDEFEALCLKICPLQQWLGMLISYT